MAQTEIPSITKLMQDLTLRGENSSEIVTLTINHIFDATLADIVALAIFTPSTGRLFIRAGVNIGQNLVAGIRKDMDRRRARSTFDTDWKSDSIVIGAAGSTDRVDDISDFLEPCGDRVVVNEHTTLILTRYYLDRQPTESHQGYMELMKSVLKVFFDKLALQRKMSSLVSDSPRVLSFLANFKGGFVITDQDGRISLINQKARAMFHKETEELNQREVTALDCSELSAAYEQACLTGESLERSVTTSRAEYCRVFVSPIEDINGYKVGWLLLMSDATQENRLRRIMMHDLKSQLNPIQSLLRYALGIAESIPDPKETEASTGRGLHDTIKQIILNFSRYAEQIDDLNYLEHMKLRREALQKSTVDLVEIIEALIDSYEKQAKEKGIEITFRPPENCLLMTDKKAISSVFRNLISNSVEHNEAQGSGSVTVEMKEEGENVIVSVSNTGKLSEEVRKTFRKGEPFSTGGVHGFGLYMARKFVLEHGGTIEVDSEKQNGGTITTFTVNLPGRIRKDEQPDDGD